MSDPETDALAAYWRFFEGCNTADSYLFTETLHFPHVRVSARGWANVVPDAETHARNNSFASLFAMGWDHTVGAIPEVLHVASDKVHIQGGWTRYTKDNEPIISNSVVYIATQLDGRWGIQARFGIDQSLEEPTPDPSADAADDEGLAGIAEKAQRIVCAALESAAGPAGNGKPFLYPYLAVHAGRIDSITDSSVPQQYWPPSRPRVAEAQALQVGPTGANVAFPRSMIGYPWKASASCDLRATRGGSRAARQSRASLGPGLSAWSSVRVKAARGSLG